MTVKREKTTATYYIPVAHKTQIEQYAADLRQQTGLDVGVSEALTLILDRFFAPARPTKGTAHAERNAA